MADKGFQQTQAESSRVMRWLVGAAVMLGALVVRLMWIHSTPIAFVTGVVFGLGLALLLWAAFRG